MSIQRSGGMIAIRSCRGQSTTIAKSSISCWESVCGETSVVRSISDWPGTVVKEAVGANLNKNCQDQ